MNPYAPNEYTRALQAVGGVLEDYDSDKMFPAMGYGAFIDGKPNHCFPLTGDPAVNCSGIAGIIQAYERNIADPLVRLHGPTYFAPVIEHATALARHSHAHNPGKEYHVLMILVRTQSVPITMICDVSGYFVEYSSRVWAHCTPTHVTGLTPARQPPTRRTGSSPTWGEPSTASSRRQPFR
jgi:hypothetical protein